MSGSPELRWEPIVNLQQQQLLLLQLQQQAYFGTSLLTTSSTKAGSSLPRGNSAVNTLSSSGSTGSFNSMSSPTNSLASSGASVGSSSNSGTLKRPSPNPVSALSWAHRKLHTVVYHDDHLYIYGGIDVDQGTWLESIVKLRIGDGQVVDYKTTGVGPGLRHSFVAAVVNGIMYVHGGVAKSGRVCQDLHSLHLASGVWTRITIHGGLEPPIRYGHSVVVHNKSLVIFGGSDGREVHSSVWILSLETFHWERVRHGSHEIIPPPRLYHSSVSLGGSFFIHGGSSKVALDGQQAFLKDCQEFQLESREWRPVESRGNNPSCCGHTAAIYQDMMVLVGGHWSEFAEPNALSCFNFVTGAWSLSRTSQPAQSDIIFTRRFQASVLVNSTLYVIGGESTNPREQHDLTRCCMKLNLAALRGSRPATITDSTFQPEGIVTRTPSSRGRSSSTSLNANNANANNSNSPTYKSSNQSNSMMTAGTPPMPPLNRLLHNRSTSGGSIKAEFMRMGSETELNGFGIVNGNGGGPSVRIKCNIGDEIRLIQLPRSVTFDRLLTTISKELGLRTDTLSIHYIDNEDDRISVRTQGDLNEAILQADEASTSASFSDEGNGILDLGRTVTLKLFLTNKNGGTVDRMPLSRQNSNSSTYGKSGVAMVNRTNSTSSQRRLSRTFTNGSGTSNATGGNGNTSPVTITSPVVSRKQKYATAAVRDRGRVGSQGLQFFRERDLALLKEGPIIGKGVNSVVQLALDPASGRFLAIKDVQPPGGASSHLIAILNEHKDKFIKIEHRDHLVQYHFFTIDNGHVRLFSEYISGGSIQDIIAKFGKLSEVVAKLYTRQILMGLDELHTRNISHGDLKSSNALLDANGVIKLSDYFVGKILNHQLADMPPSEPKEIFMQCKDDIHRVGLLMLEMLSGTSSSSLSTFLPADAPLIPESVSPDASDFMLQCFNKEWTLRPSAADLLQHPFLTVRARARSLVRIARTISTNKINGN